MLFLACSVINMVTCSRYASCLSSMQWQRSWRVLVIEKFKEKKKKRFSTSDLLYNAVFWRPWVLPNFQSDCNTRQTSITKTGWKEPINDLGCICRLERGDISGFTHGTPWFCCWHLSHLRETVFGSEFILWQYRATVRPRPGRGLKPERAHSTVKANLKNKRCRVLIVRAVIIYNL